MAAPRHTAFHHVQAQLGATFSEEDGWLWSDSFGDTEREYRAVRGAVGVCDVSPMGKWEFRGPEALRAAQRVHTADVLGMEIGQIHYGAFCAEDGTVRDDGTIFKFADDLAWVIANVADHDEAFAAASEGMDVGIHNITAELPNLQVQGPDSRRVLAEAVDADLDCLKWFRFFPQQVSVGGVPVWLSRTGFSGELGYELFVRPEHAAELWSVVTNLGCLPYGMAALSIMGVESGLLVRDWDYEPFSRTPYELSLDRFVHLERDFLGRNALVGAAERRRFQAVCLSLNSREPASRGAPILRAGKTVGEVTTPALSPSFGAIALASVDPTLADGDEVEVDGVAAKISTNPLYDPEKRRPRS